MSILRLRVRRRVSGRGTSRHACKHEPDYIYIYIYVYTYMMCRYVYIYIYDIVIRIGSRNEFKLR